MSILGNRVLHTEGPKFLTVGATSVDDIRDDRLSHLGIRHIDMPATPQRVWAAIQAAS